MVSTPSFAAFCGDRQRYGRERDEEAGYLLIEQVRRAGDLGLTRARNGGDDHFFSALPTQRHVGFRFLLRKGSIDAGLAGKKVLCRAEDLGGTVRGRRFLER